MLKLGFANCIANIPSIICFVIAGAMALRGVDGWGWMVFVGFISSVTVRCRSTGKED